MLMKTILPADVVGEVMGFLYDCKITRGEDDFENPYHIKLKLKNDNKIIIQDFYSKCYICCVSYADMKMFRKASKDKYCYQYCFPCYRGWKRGTGPPPKCRKPLIIDTNKTNIYISKKQYKDKMSSYNIMCSRPDTTPDNRPDSPFLDTTNDSEPDPQDPKQEPLSEFYYVGKWEIKFGKYKNKKKTYGDLAGMKTLRGADKDYLRWCYEKGMWNSQKYESNEKIKAFIEDYIINRFTLMAKREDAMKNYLQFMHQKLGDEDFAEFEKTY